MKPRTNVQLQVEELEGRLTPSTTFHDADLSTPGVIIVGSFTTTPGLGAEGITCEFGNPLNPQFPDVNTDVPFPPRA